MRKPSNIFLRVYHKAKLVLNKHIVSSLYSCKAETSEWTRLSRIGTIRIHAHGDADGHLWSEKLLSL